MKKRLVAAAVLILIVFACIPGAAVKANAARSTSQVTRYTVLVLDTTGQYTITPGYLDTVTVGSPLENVKQAAYRFVEEVLAAEGTNYVALVTCTDTASVVSNFSDNVAELNNAIKSIPEDSGYSSSGFSNFSEALDLADGLLREKNEAFVIRNILFFSGCLPAAGAFDEDGYYSGPEFEYYQGFYVTATNIMVYQHANAVYKTAERLKAEGYNIYTLSCFTNLDQQQESYMFAKRVMQDIQNRGFFDAVDPEDIVIEIGEAAKEIVKPDITEYYRVIRINCPVDVEVYDDIGTFFGSIIGNKPSVVPDSGILLSYDDNDEKTIVLPVDRKFNIKIVGTDSGEMTCSITEYSREAGGNTRIVNFFDILLKKGDEYNASLELVKDDGSKTEYVLEGPGGVVVPDDDFAQDEIPVYVADVAIEGNGAASGGGAFFKGEFTKLSASPGRGEQFLGWFQNEALVSSELAFKLCVRADMALTAKFTSGGATPAPQPSLTPRPSPSVSPIPDGMGGPAQGSGTQVALIFIVIAAAAVFTTVIAVASRNRTRAGAGHGAGVAAAAAPYGQDVYGQDMYGQPAAAGYDAGYAADAGMSAPADAYDDAYMRSGAVTVLSGSKKGTTLKIAPGSSVTLGKNALSLLAFPDDYVHVSRTHCTISYDARANMYSVTDTSSNGTFSGSRQLPKGQPSPVMPGTTLTLANDYCSIMLE